MDTLMNVIIPHPDPLPLPAPAGLVWFLLVLTFILHLLPMNFILGGSIVALFLGRGDDNPRQAVRSFLARGMPPMVAAAVSFGVAPLLLTQVLFGRLFFSSSVLMAWYWISVIPLLIVAYYGTYLVSFKGRRLGAARPLVSAVIALIFLAIAFIYTGNMSLMIAPQRFAELHGASASGTAYPFADSALAPRWLHMVFGALAVTGLVIAFYGARRLRDDEETGRYAVRLGCHWFLASAVVNIGVGLWWLMALPREAMLRFMGGSPLASASLGLGVVLVLGALVVVQEARKSEAPMKPLLMGSGLAAAGLVFMVLMRDQVRQGALGAAGYALPEWLEPKWGQLSVFIVLLLLAAVTVVWMVRKLARPEAG